MLRSGLLVLLLLAGIALAASKKPATTAAPDASAAVRAALLMYDKITGTDEADKALRFYHAPLRREQAIAKLLARLDGVLAALQKQAEDRFGRDEADKLVRLVGAKTAQDINASKITVERDTARVFFPGDSEPMEMVCVKGEWKISVKAMIHDVSDDLKSFRKSLAELADEVKKVSEEIRGGRYSTPEPARKRLEDARKKAFSPSDE